MFLIPQMIEPIDVTRPLVLEPTTRETIIAKAIVEFTQGEPTE